MNTDAEASFSHWRQATDLDGVCWLTLDRAGENVNSLSREVLEELESIVDGLERHPPAGLVLQSGKPGSFVVGADIREFGDTDSASEAAGFIGRVHDLFNRIEALPFPKAVTIEGNCLGGGVELALTFDYRIARGIPETRLGFPEVQLGLYPGFGGSARAPALIGGLKALPMMLSGRPVRAGEARGMGLVDEVVGRHQSLRWAARRAVLRGRRARQRGVISRLLDRSPARSVTARMMRRQVAKRANPRHYPAPYELIDAWEACGTDRDAMLKEEAERVGRLVTGETSRNLRRVFWLMERLKSQGGSAARVRRVHVIGAGVMGGDIAAWCACQGLEVTLQDREMKTIEPALERAAKLFRKRLKTPDLVAGAKSRLIADVEGRGLARAQVVIEAIFEDVAAKQALFREVEEKAPADALLATNTSAIPLADLAGALSSPGRLIGLHFFNPVARMPLVEVVHDEASDPAEVDRGAAFCRQINRYPLPVRSSPGFLVNRVLAPYMLKALDLKQSRALPIEAIDAAATAFGMPMGPVELADTVGLDVGLSVMKLLGGGDRGDNSGDSESGAEALLASMVEDGKLGRKSGRGFYRWRKGKPVKGKSVDDDINLESLGLELMDAYLEECRRCLEEGIVEDADMLDAGMIFGTGFAPFRGGPMHYLNQRRENGPDRNPDLSPKSGSEQGGARHD